MVLPMLTETKRNLMLIREYKEIKKKPVFTRAPKMIIIIRDLEELKVWVTC